MRDSPGVELQSVVASIHEVGKVSTYCDLSRVLEGKNGRKGTISKKLGIVGYVEGLHISINDNNSKEKSNM